MNGFNVKKDKQATGVQFMLDNGQLVTLVAGKPENDKAAMYSNCHVTVTKIIDIATGNVEHLTKFIMDSINHTPTKEETDKDCKLFINTNLDKFFEVLNFVRNIKKEEYDNAQEKKKRKKTTTKKEKE